MANTPTPVAPSSGANNSKVNISLAAIVIPALFIVSYCVFKFVFGNGANFQGGNNEGHPLPGNYFGQVYKGGFIVPILMTMFLIVVTFVIERFITISKAQGSGSTVNFVRKVKLSLVANNVDGAIRECDTHKGSVANIVPLTREPGR